MPFGAENGLDFANASSHVARDVGAVARKTNRRRLSWRRDPNASFDPD